MTERPAIIFGQPWFGAEEEELLLRTLRSGWIGQGPLVAEFERRLADYVGSPDAVAVSSCTAALHLSLLAAGIGPGDEVVTTPFTFVATLNAIEHTGATAVLVDPEPASLNLTPAAVEAAITERTRAVVPVHFGGFPLDVDGFAGLAEEYGIWIVEDAAHAVGGVAGGRPIGNCAHARSVVCFSFYPNKNLASAEGGAVCTRDAKLAERIRQLRLHGLEGDAWARYRTDRYRPSLAHAPGYKYNWTDLQAAIALPQLERLEGFLATREQLAVEYDALLQDVPGIVKLQRPPHTLDRRHALHLYQVIVDAPAPARDEVLKRLRQAGIGAAVHYVTLTQHPYYLDRFASSSYPVSEWASDSLLTLPLHVHMHSRDVARVSTSLQSAVREVLA